MTAWNDTFDSTLQWQDTAFLNMMLHACWERSLASGIVEGVSADPPEVEHGDDIQTQVPDWEVFEPSRAAYDAYDVGFILKNVMAMQVCLENNFNAYARRDVTIIGTGPTFPATLQLTPQYVSEELGRDPGESYSAIAWRRRRPMEVFAEDIQGETTHGYWTWLTGFLFWGYTGRGLGFVNQDVPVGAKAAWMKYDGFASGEPSWDPEDSAENPHPGRYQGVWEYQGGGVWTPTPAGTDPTEIDTNNAISSGVHLPPGLIQQGDIIGWHLFQEIRDVCNMLTWTLPTKYLYIRSSGAGTVVDGGSTVNPVWQADETEGWLRKTGDSGVGHPDEATAKAAASADYAAETPVLTTFLGLAPQQNAVWNTSYFAVINGMSFQYGHAEVYRGLAHKTEWYAMTNDGSGTIEYDSTAFGIASVDVWAKVGDEDHAAGAHDWGVELDPVVQGNFVEPPYSATPGQDKGARLTDAFPLIKWDVAGGFQYTEST